MSLPVFRRFSLQDIPDAPDWIQNILGPLNLFCETTVSSLNKNLTIGQNVVGMKYTTTFLTPPSYDTGGFNQISFAYSGGGFPDCCLIGQITNAAGGTILLPTSVSSWFLNQNTNPSQIVVNYIAGLTASTKYNITFLVV